LDEGYRLNDLVFDPPHRHEIYLFSKRPDRLWGPLSPLVNNHYGDFTRVIKLQCMKLTTVFYLVPVYGMTGVTNLLPPCACVPYAWTTPTRAS